MASTPAARTSGPAPARTVVRFEIAPRSIVLVLATIAGVWLFLQLRMIALVVIVALVLAGTFKPLVEWLERRGLQRMLALTLLFVALLLVTSLLAFLTVPPLLDQVSGIFRNAPTHRAHLVTLLQQRELTAPFARAVQQSEIAPLFTQLEHWLLGSSARAATALGWGITTLFLSFYILADGKRTQGALFAVVPRGYHMRLARILQNLEVIVGGYMRGQLITSAAIGVFTFLLLVAFKVPNALAIALFAALADLIPFVGGLLATAPAVLSALSRGVPVALAVLGILYLYQETENRILIPRIYGRLLRLTPITVVLALLAGGLLLGIIGALLAIPIAAGLQMILEELQVDLPGDDSDRSDVARDARTEAEYEQRSAGATASEAGQIARNLAHDLRIADAADAAAAEDAAQAAAGATP